MEAPRYKVNAKGRRTRLCKGKGNTCTKEAKLEQLCTGCKTGFDKTFFLNRDEGEVFVKGDIRYIFIGGQSRHLCQGDDNTCTHIRKDGDGLCQGHKNGTVQTSNAGLKAGDRMVLNGIRYIFDGHQKARLCIAITNGESCNIKATKEGKCKSHSPHWNCMFTDDPCKSLKIDGTDYCTIHANNVLNLRAKFKGEIAVSEYLDSVGIAFTTNNFVKFRDKVMYPDFQLPDGSIIEFDGAQHFDDVKYWGGDVGLATRVESDLNKDRWCIETGRALLRIDYKNIDHVDIYIDAFLQYIMEFPPGPRGYVLATSFYESLDREYIII
jgi:hypothetical protein